MRRNLAVPALILVASAATVATTRLGRGGPAPRSDLRKKAPPELGDVAWLRDAAAARARSAASGRPILILFDEVPGCATCVSYGQTVLTHPLIVEAIEREFVPLAVFNNRGGADRELLKRLGEPAWNNPVVRIVDARYRALAPRLAGDHSVAGLARNIRQALETAGRPVPPYVRLTSARPDSKLRFAMGCFWSGEACLGALDGVASTRTGWMAGREVVEVRFDTSMQSAPAFLEAARPCADALVLRSESSHPRGWAVVETKDRLRPSPTDDQHHLARSPWRSVPLTRAQRSRINADPSANRDPTRWLSPGQRRLAEIVVERAGVSWPEPDPDDLRGSWAAAWSAAEHSSAPTRAY